VLLLVSTTFAVPRSLTQLRNAQVGTAC
jgi:hypothetical protein